MRQSVPYLLSIVLLGVFASVLMLGGCGGNTPDAVFNRGLRALQDEDPIGASLFFENFVKKFPDDERVLTAYDMLAKCYLMLKDYSNARNVFLDMKKKFPHTNVQTRCDFEIGNTYYYEGFFEKAATQYAEIASATDNPQIRIQANFNLASLYGRMTQAATAQRHFDTVYQIADEQISDPTEQLGYKLQSLAGKATVLEVSGEFDQAREVHRKNIDIVLNATGITGIDVDRQNAVLSWAHTWVKAGDFISAATTYDLLHSNPHIKEEMKPQLVVWKIQSLESLFMQVKDKTEFTPEETELLAHENRRIIKDYSDTEYGISARIAVARLIRDTTPDQANMYFNEAIGMYEKFINDPPTPERPLIAMFQIAESYLRFDKFDEAKQTLLDIQKKYSQVPEAVQKAAMGLQTIERIKQDKLKAAQKAAEVPVSSSTSP